MVRSPSLVFVLLVIAGCDAAPASKGKVEDVEYESQSRDRLLGVRVNDLTNRINDLEKKIDDARMTAESTASAHDSLVDTFNSNVNMENAARVRRLTANGACGQETYYPKDGGVVFRNKECTLKDLR